MRDGNGHIHFERAADEQVDAVGVVALDPHDNGKLGNVAGGEGVRTTAGHDGGGGKLRRITLGACAVAARLGVGGGDTVYVQAEANGFVQAVGDVR